MTSMFRKVKNIQFNPRKSRGVSILIVTMILLVATTLIALFAANFTMLQTQLTANQYRNSQAFEAAEAGLNYAAAYLQTNLQTVVASPSNGYINYSIATTTLANGSSYSVTIRNPTQNSYTVLTITSTGTNADGTATEVVSQQVASSGISLSYTITSQSGLTAGGSATVVGGSGADLGGTVSLSGSATVSNVTQNDTTLANMDPNTLFYNIFGLTPTQMQAQSTFFSNGSTVTYSNLSNQVWVNSDYSLSSNGTIGSIANPVQLFVNGNFRVTGSVTFYGLIYVFGTTYTGGNFSLFGGLVSLGGITMQGSSYTYDSTVLKKMVGARNFAWLPGSWKDF